VIFTAFSMGVSRHGWHPVSMESSGKNDPQVTVWYDGDCPLCLREIGLMRRLDTHGAIAFIDVHEGKGCPLEPEVLLERFHAQERGKTLVSGAEAFAAMWRAIPLLRPLGLLARNRLVLAALERAYRCFLRYRPRLQRLAGADVQTDGP
jgi:predicted DCC family thiol-disulfide oxidoreductase YuxK